MSPMAINELFDFFIKDSFLEFMKYKTLPGKPTGHEFVRYHLVHILDLAVTELPLLSKNSREGLPGDAAISLQQLSPNAASLRSSGA